MKQRRSFLLLVTSIFLSIFISFGCSSDDTNPAGGSDALVGTWDIASITSSVEGTNITIYAADIPMWLLLVPDLGMVPGTIVLNADGTYHVTYLSDDVETGTWTASESVLSVIPQGDTIPVAMPYTVSGNTATISLSADSGDSGTLSGELVYTKR